MTASELAAWVSAGAAVLQAIGAVGAIWASVWIGQKADRRSAEAVAEAVAREKVAAAASAAREEAADRAAESRYERNLTSGDDMLIETTESLLSQLINQVSELEMDLLSRIQAGPTGDIGQTLGFQGLRDLQNTLPDSIGQSKRADLRLAFMDLLNFVNGILETGFFVGSAQDFMDRLAGIRLRVESVRSKLNGLHSQPDRFGN